MNEELYSYIQMISVCLLIAIIFVSIIYIFTGFFDFYTLIIGTIVNSVIFTIVLRSAWRINDNT